MGKHKKEKQTITSEEIKKLEENAIESSTHGDKPYRKKYRQGFTLLHVMTVEHFKILD